MAHHEFHAVGGELVGDRDALLGIGDVVAIGHHDFLAENAAGIVDVGDRLFGAVLELRAEGRIGAGDRAADAELDGVALVLAAGRQRQPEPSARPSVMSFFIDISP